MDRRAPTKEHQHPKQVPLRAFAQMLGRRLSRRGLLKAFSKSAVAVTATFAGVIPFLSKVQTALACYWCMGCTGTCQWDYSECTPDVCYAGTCWDGPTCACLELGTRIQAYSPFYESPTGNCTCWCRTC